MAERDAQKFPHKVEGVWHSDKQVLQSNAGFFIGTTCWDPNGGFEDIGSRESDYFPTFDEAQKALKSGEFDERDCIENVVAYNKGLPRPHRNQRS
jgi:hypothetical protein